MLGEGEGEVRLFGMFFVCINHFMGMLSSVDRDIHQIDLMLSSSQAVFGSPTS